MIKYLVPTDYSANSLDALQYAIQLANKQPSIIYLYHFYQIKEKAGMIMSFTERLQEENEMQLEDLVATVAHLTEENTRIEIKAKSGDAATLINWNAELHGVDYIVMGAQGETMDAQVSFGSTLGGVIKTTTTPILIIPPNYIGGIPKRILFAFRKLTTHAHEVIRPFRWMLSLCKAKLSVLHVVVSEEDTMDVELGDLFTHQAFHEVEIQSASLPAGVATYLENNPMDWVCMIKRNRGIFERLFTTNRFYKEDFSIPIPVLLVPEWTTTAE
ncbi:MAG: universal stress protein [Saprospiraceae bacterium]|nr:universal stress protein [Saprospiraceae bacterium]MCB9320806.1 universal stress protein [Lewinellaceae bacterium]